MRCGCFTIATAAIASASAFAQSPPAVVADVPDGTPYDIVASRSRAYLAQGRLLAVLNPVTGDRIPAEEMLFDQRLVAVELDDATDQLYVATSHRVEVHDLLGVTPPKIWNLPAGEQELQDLKIAPAINKIFVLSTDKVRVLDDATANVVELGQDVRPADLLAFYRLQTHELWNGTWVAFGIGPLVNSTNRDKNGMAPYRLNPGGVWAPQYGGTTYNPQLNHGVRASVQYLQVTSDAGADTAWVACGQAANHNALVMELDVSDPANIQEINPHELPHPFDARNIVKDSTEQKLWIAATNRLYRIDLPGPVIVGHTGVSFGDAGDRDMAYIEIAGLGAWMWTATHGSLDYVLHFLRVDDLTPGYLPVELFERWWVSSSDGGVAVPALDSVYLPTFGGVVRYDVSNLANPVPAADTVAKPAFQPSTSNTEHVAWLPTSSTSGFVVSVRGAGGFEAYEANASEPNPAAPVAFVDNPSGNVYANGIDVYVSGGERYVLADVTDKSPPVDHHYYLQAWRWMGGSSFQKAAEVSVVQSGGLGNSHVVYTSDDHAFLGGEELFFVTDLSNLPTSMSVTDVQSIAPYDGVRGFAATPTHLFVAVDGPAALLVYSWDPNTGQVGSFVTRYSAPDFSVASGVRRNRLTDRLYVGGGHGRLFEFDITNPAAPSLFSTYQGPYLGLAQDCHLFVEGGKPYILFVKNNESFAILDPDDGL